MLALGEHGLALGKQGVELRLLLGDTICVALLVGRPRIGRGLLLKLTEIVLDDLDASLDL